MQLSHLYLILACRYWKRRASTRQPSIQAATSSSVSQEGKCVCADVRLRAGRSMQRSRIFWLSTKRLRFSATAAGPSTRATTHLISSTWNKVRVRKIIQNKVHVSFGQTFLYLPVQKYGFTNILNGMKTHSLLRELQLELWYPEGRYSPWSGRVESYSEWRRRPTPVLGPACSLVPGGRGRVQVQGPTWGAWVSIRLHTRFNISFFQDFSSVDHQQTILP